MQDAHVSLIIRILVMSSLIGHASAQPSDTGVTPTESPSSATEPALAGSKMSSEESAATTRMYAFVGVGLGGMVSDVSVGGIDRSEVSVLRASLGAQRGDAAGVNYRLGGTFDMFFDYGSSIALGIEGQIDHPVIAGLRVGGRASVGLSSKKRPLWTIGMRVRHRVVSCGVDVLGFGAKLDQSPDHAVGVIGVLGLDGRAGKYGIAIGAGLGIIVAGLSLAALQGTH
jgi:hypothetical protein